MNRVVLFDLDGVLVDSLPAHLKICNDKNLEYSLNLKIPNRTEFQRLVRSGVVISPMQCFFEAVGFPKNFALQADECYQREFRVFYSTTMFDGVDLMLKRLKNANLNLGIVTSNTIQNAYAMLGSLRENFELIVARDDPFEMSKSEGIRFSLNQFDVDPQKSWYVGDQYSDAIAAQQANVKFIGVTYGWCISNEDDYQLANDPQSIADLILEH